MKLEHPVVKFKRGGVTRVYNELWSICEQELENGLCKDADGKTLFVSTADKTVSQLNAITSTFFLVFARKSYPVVSQLDYFYERQEEDGAIRSNYDIASGKFSPQHKNPVGFGTPLFSWAEFNLYHKCLDDKKRIRRVLVILEKYWEWLESVALQENGLYAVPLAAMGMHNCPRGKVKYPLDFNLQQAINAHYMAELGSIVNDKDLTFRYRKKYFGLRSQINSLMWNDKQGFYFDLDEKGKQLKTKSVAAFWSLLAKIPNESRFVSLLEHLDNKREFGGEMAIPTISRSHSTFSDQGNGYNGSVFPLYTFMVVKGLEQYAAYRRAHNIAAKHLDTIIDIAGKIDSGKIRKKVRAPKNSGGKGAKKGSAALAAARTSAATAAAGGKRGKHQPLPQQHYHRLFEAYRPDGSAPAYWSGKRDFPRAGYLPELGLAGITLLIENVIGLNYSVPRKSVDLTVPDLEEISIEKVDLLRNTISIICEKTPRGWEARLIADKLCYFTINILNIKKKKTLPIPSGRCSLLINKL